MQKNLRVIQNKILLLFLVAIIGFGTHAASVSAETVARMIPESFSSLAKKAKPAVVNIRTVKVVKGGGRVFRHFFGNPYGGQDPFQGGPSPFGNGPTQDFKQKSLGSGFILDSEGYIVTNNHVIDGADQIKVKLSNENEYDAKVIGRDPKTDLALIKIDAKEKLTPLPLGNSDTIDVGRWVVAIGSPFGLEQTVTAGIVSAKGRIIGSGPYDDFIQTDASINPGNSGGPLIDMDGKVVGINTAIVASGQGIGFAIPINMASVIISQLKSTGEVSRGWLGVGIQDLTPDLADYYKVKDVKGVLVTESYKGDPAYEAGIRRNDVIVSVDGKEVASTRELSIIIANLGPDKKVPVVVYRNGKKKKFKVTTGKRDDAEWLAKRQSEQGAELGLRLAEMTPSLALKYGYYRSEKGLLIIDILDKGPALKTEIMRGDLIKEIGGKQVTTLDDYYKIVKKIKKGNSVILLVKRRNSGYRAVKITK